MRWTPHMEDCLKTLERELEYPSDEVFVAFIKFQLIGEEAQKLLIRDIMGDTSQAPTYVFKKGLLAKLQEMREGHSVNLVTNRKLAPHTPAIVS